MVIAFYFSTILSRVIPPVKEYEVVIVEIPSLKSAYIIIWIQGFTHTQHTSTIHKQIAVCLQ